MAQIQISGHMDSVLYVACHRQASLEGKAVSRWIIDVCRDRIRALGKLPEELEAVSAHSRGLDYIDGKGMVPLKTPSEMKAGREQGLIAHALDQLNQDEQGD